MNTMQRIINSDQGLPLTTDDEPYFFVFSNWIHPSSSATASKWELFGAGESKSHNALVFDAVLMYVTSKYNI